MTSDAPAAMSDPTTELIALAAAGDQPALGRLMERFRDRLARVVRFRMDRRLLGRLDPDDVVQEAFLEAIQRLPDDAPASGQPFFIWLRFITIQKLMMLHRHHVNVQLRSANREVPLHRNLLSGATSADLAAWLLDTQTSPSQVVVREEMRSRLETALNGMDALDREVLALRHFEQLANVEAARVLGLTPTAASNRYIRAIRRLRTILDDAQHEEGTGV